MAIKKIMKPFSTPVLAKRTYRELKLLKHIRHENVSPSTATARPARTAALAHLAQIISLSDVFISPLEDLYFVTELLGTDLHRLLTSRPLEKQFVQYFLYQIMRGLKYVHSAGVVHRDLVRRFTHPETQQHFDQRKLRPENLRLWSRACAGPADDWLCLDAILPCS